MTTSATPTSLGDVLRSAAKHLRNDPAAEYMAVALESLSSALRKPNGYVVKALGGGIRYDLCAAPHAEADRAAVRKNMPPGTYTIEPFLVLHP